MENATGIIGRTAANVSRRGFALGLGLLFGAKLAPGVAAEKNTKKQIPSIKSRVQAQRELCETIGGGTLTVFKKPGGTTTYCTGGEEDGLTCTNSSKKTRCFQAATRPANPWPDIDPNDLPVLEPIGESPLR